MVSPIQRHLETAARRTVLAARKDWRLHRKLCRICGDVFNGQVQYCKEGWYLAQQLVAAKKERDRLTDPLVRDQGTLF